MSQRIKADRSSGLGWDDVDETIFQYDLKTWLREHADNGIIARNADWSHMDNRDIISMPDKWEYPWYATWDSAFHTFALAQVDPEFAKNQLLLFLSDRYMHPMA